MNIHKTQGVPHSVHRRLPFIAHALELFIGLIIIAVGQNLFATMVGASPDVVPPSVPSNVQVTARSAASIDLTWDASTDNVGVTGYRIFRDGTMLTTSSAPSYTDSGLTPSTNYSYAITAYDAAANESAQSVPVPTSTLADTSPPSVPANVRQTGQTISTVSIAWNASADNVGVSGYRVYRNGTLVRTQVGTSFTDSGLAVYSGYIYNITAYDATNNSSGLSPDFVGSTAQDTTPPSVPDNLRQTAGTVTTVTLAWNSSTDDVGVSGYRVYRNGTLIASPNGTTYTATGLSVNATYSFTVLAFDAAGNASNQSAPLTANSAADTTAPSIPQNLRTTDIKDTSLAIAWNSSTDDVGVVAYKLYRDGVLVASPSTTSYTDTNLQPITGYRYTVRATDAAGNTSADSLALNATTAYDTTAPSIPQNLRTTAQTDSSITLSWDASTDNVGVSGYDLYRGSTLITTTSGLTYTDTGLNVQTGYTYKLRAHDASGNNSVDSVPNNTTTLADHVAPSIPNGLASSATTTSATDVTWNAASDDIAVTGYRIYRNGVFLAATTTLTFSDGALHYGRSYSYEITAVDAAGNESIRSAPLVVSTLPDTTAPTISLQAPTPNQDVKFIIPFTATASDDLELSSVVFAVDGTPVANVVAVPFSYNWDSSRVGNGTHTVTATAIDASGNSTAVNATISVTNPPPPRRGDVNGDYKVNIYDLSALLANWNKPGIGDFNHSGRVDIFDLSVLLSEYGK
ncbi:fibronectin type III domain-containing protein [Candidatus Saccharibacteria bacterium]|nr:fibronectin type III domain-containing protein [Candidatus Saccharibacteria bacterium]